MTGRHGVESGGEPAPADIRITGGSPDAEELAAVTAVLGAALAQLSSEERREEQGDSPWDRSRRAPRNGVVRGGWRSWSH